MRRVIGMFLCPLFLFITSATTPVLAQASTLKVEPGKPLRKGVDAWPLIVNPANPAEQKVNATLTRLNLSLTKALTECDAAALADMKQSHTPQKDWPGALAEDWSRKVEVTMQGPQFFSLVATDEYVHCGGAHPNSDTMAMVFDMTTGTPVNWLALVSKSVGASVFADAVSDGSQIGALVLPALAQLNLDAASDDCKDAFQDPQSFQLWPDAKTGTLVAQAFDLPHAAADCAVQIPLTMEQARTLGFDENLLSSIDQAHRLFAAAPPR
jgi:hypothetical protein